MVATATTLQRLSIGGHTTTHFLKSSAAAGGLLMRPFVDSQLSPLLAKRTPVILDGPVGSGKTCILEHAVALHRQSHPDAVVVHIPDATEYFDGRYIYSAAPVPTGTLPGTPRTWNLPTATSALLGSIARSNTKPAASTSISASYAFGTSATVDSGSPLSALLAIGAKDVERAEDVAEAVFAELRLLPNAMLAVDAVNALFSSSMYHDHHSHRIPSRHFAFGKNLLPFFQAKSKSVVLGATSRANPRYPATKQASIAPAAVVVPVPALARAEVSDLLRMYRATGISASSSGAAPIDAEATGELPMDESEIDRVLLLSGGNPAKVLDLARAPTAF
ncbi:mitochondrial ribosomal death-associated protein 3-domain-containing protein [Blastocladiella britannica]|nr:mitochondrial ribosomal death-associated protein 3-domain-containing protein [Blastocladiella britannica]